MATKGFTAAASSPLTKIRAEQIKAELVSGGALSDDLDALKTQVAEIIGGSWDQDVPTDAPNVQLLDLAAHISASAPAAKMEVLKNLDVVGQITGSAVRAENLNAVEGGIVFASAAGDLDNDVALKFASGELTVAGVISGSGALNIDGLASLAQATVEDISASHIVFAGTGGRLKGESAMIWDEAADVLKVTGELSASLALKSGGSLAVAGAATVAGTLGVTGESTLASATVSDLDPNKVVLASTNGELVVDGEISWSAGTLTVSGSTYSKNASVAGTFAVASTSQFNDNVTIAANKTLTVGGDLIVQGTTTTVNSTVLTVDDINIELGSSAAPTDSTADGGGITLKGTTDHTIIWRDAQDAWEFSEHLVPSGTLDLGLTGDRWQNLWLAGNADVDGNADVAGTLNVVGASTLAGLSAGASSLASAAIAGALVVTGSTDLNALAASEIKIDGDVAERLYIVNGDGSMKDEQNLIYNGTRLAVTGAISGSAQVSGASFKADGLADVGSLLVSGQSRFMSQVRLDAAAVVSGSIVPSAGSAFNVGSGANRYVGLFAGGADLTANDAVQLQGGSTQNIVKRGSGNLVLSSSVAAGFVMLDDAYRGGTLLNSATAGLKLANSGEWATFASAYPTVDSILGAFNTIAAGGGAEKGVFELSAVSATTAINVSAGAGMADLSFAGLTKDNSMVFFNGQLLRSGSVADLSGIVKADYSFDDGKTAVQFAFAVEAGDVLVVQKL